MERILLDEFGDAELPEGYVVIESEVDFLRTGLTDSKLLIRGVNLCAWAKRLYTGREMKYGHAISPIRTIQERYPALSPADVKDLRERMKALPENWQVAEVMNAAWPADFWFEPPNRSHAARYLLWLTEGSVPNYIPELLRQVTEDWSLRSGVYGSLYQATSSNTADELLGKWILANDGKFTEKFGAFPMPVPPSWKDRQLEYWRNEITLGYEVFIQDFLKFESPYEDKVRVAVESLKYFQLNPQALTKELAGSFARYLSPNQRDALNQLIPVPMPSQIPDSADDVVSWVRKEYLPFRTQALRGKNNNAWERSISFGREFALWFLDKYQALLAANDDFTYRRSKNLLTYKDTVNLVVLLDGLNLMDGENLMAKLMERENAHHLVLIEDGASFTMLPTVTEFTKKHILFGSMVYEQTEDSPLGADSSDLRNPKQLVQTANPGDIIFWRLMEPDATYHSQSSSDDLDMKVDAALYGVAQRITNLVEHSDPQTKLRVIITTDHGRILGTSNKDLEFPEGFETHGRASWGVKEMEFGAKGYRVEGDIAYLSKGTFMLEHETAAVSIGQDAFKYGRYKTEQSPHGGVFPEEVIVPWMVFEREVERPNFSVGIEGSGVAPKVGTATLTVLNTSEYVAILKYIRYEFSADNKGLVPLELPIEAKRLNKFNFNIEKWPSVEKKEAGKGVAVIELPNGERIEERFTTEKLESRSMSQRDNILGGMD